MTSLVEVAADGARAGARVLVQRAGDLGNVRTKGSPTDFVTDVDIAAGVAVVRAILRHDPTARFVVEEPEVCEIVGCTVGSLTDERVWVIDPLDGTTSYIHGYPCFSVSVALLEGGHPICGAILNAANGELFTAAAAQGAFLDDSPIRVTRATELQRSLVVTGFPYDRGAPLERQLRVLAAVLRGGVQGIRRDGSAAIDLTHVACGRADGFWELSLQPWDTAAGVLLVREAGGLVTGSRGEPWRPDRDFDVVAAGPALHELLLDIIATADAQ